VQIVEPLDEARVFDDAGRPAYTLCGREQYLLHDCEARKGIESGALRSVCSQRASPPTYRGEPLNGHRLMLPFIGRLGDAIVTASCLNALKERFPSAEIDIACLPAARGVFRLLPAFGELIEYPPTAERLAEYHYLLSFEEIEEIKDGLSRSCADVFSAALHTPRPVRTPAVAIPGGLRARWALPDKQSTRVALHVPRIDNLRSYPHDLLGELSNHLTAAGFDVLLVGEDCQCHISVDWRTRVTDLRGKTPTPADLAAALVQMDAVFTSDSFPMHLAGTLGVPTVTVFAPTSAIIAGDYANVTAVQSSCPCSPCHAAGGGCPRGHHGCIAHRDPSLSPRRIAERIISVASKSGTQAVTTSATC